MSSCHYIVPHVILPLYHPDRYDSSSGVFTVPLGGDGFYYFSTYLTGDDGEFAHFSIELNNDVICSTFLDTNDNGVGDAAAGSCSAVVDVVAGNSYFK